MVSHRSLSLGAVAALVVVAAGSTASADVLVSTLSSSATAAAPRIDQGHLHAVEFTTGNSGWVLTSIDAILRSNDTVNASIYSDNAGSPGAEVFALESVGSTNSTYTQVSFNAGSEFVFEADTTYHLVIGATGSTGNWRATTVGNTVVDGVGSVVGGRESSDTDGATWSNFSDFTPLFQINGTAVPAPATAGLAALGGLAALRRRR